MPEPTRSSFIVEFAGLPGVGKSTLSHAAAAALRESGEIVTEPTREIIHDPRRQRRKFVLAAGTLARHPVSSLAAIRQIFVSGQNSLRDFGATAFNFLYVCRLIEIYRKTPGIHFVDQGCVNALWSIGYSASRSPAFARLNEIGQDCCGGQISDLVVLVEARRSTVAERLRARPGAQSRLERNVTGSRFDAEFETAWMVYQRILDLVESHGGDSPGGIRFETIENDEAENFELQKNAIVAVIRRTQSSYDQAVLV